MSNQREEGRQNWTGGRSVETINSGSLQRIADATELIAQNYDRLIRDRDYYKGNNQRLRRELESSKRSNAALRGHVTRLKRQLKEATQ